MLRKVAPQSITGDGSRRPAEHRSRRLCAALAAGTAAIVIAAGTGPAALAAPPTPDAEDAALAFDSSAYTTLTVSVDGVPTQVRHYEELCYVADPVLMAAQQQLPPFASPPRPANPECGFQSLNVFVPESAVDDDETALYFTVNNAGWFASYIRASVTDGATYDSAVSNVGAALKAGYVFIDVATRSRGVLGADGTYPGKAPAAAVDAKAAVRYLRLNDDAMPGSAERIVVNGTSGGGALASILGASGNSRDYLPYLAEIGAAGVADNGRSTLGDDVLAINAYCPITDLGNADIAYEWLYSVLGTRATVGEDKWPETTAALAAAFPDYQKSLKLRGADGSKLSADTMLAEIEREVVISAEAFMSADSANVITGYDWIQVDNDTDAVESVDMAKYLQYVAEQRQLKPAPSFDQTGTSAPGAGGGPGTGESNLFGTATESYSNFTAHSWDDNISAGDGIGLDDTGLTWERFIRQPSTIVDEQIRLLDPLQYIDTRADTAPYWYVRNGALDRDTAFTISINLERALDADRSVRDVDYRLAWDTNHGGNYDVPEAMQWIAGVLADAG